MELDVSALVGKTIKSATKMMKKDFDDTGYLKLEFTDGTSMIIVGGFDQDYTGESENEYQTTVKAFATIDGLYDPTDSV